MTSLPTLVSAHWPDLAVLDSPGGFCWWYADLVGSDDRALVLIVAWGLPFLPGYAGAARRGVPERPLDRPSVTLAVVDRGRTWFWMVHELRALELVEGELRCELGTVRIAPGPAFSLRADLAGRCAGADWAAKIEVRGEGRVGSEDPHAEHEWNVLCAGASARAEVVTAGRSWSLEGRAYVDRNACPSPLHAVSGPWCWGRVALPDGDLVWYTAEESRAVRVGGRTEVGPGPRIAATRLGRWGQRIPVALDLDGRRISLQPVDQSPFYTRFLAQSDGARGVAEWCEPGRVDGPWFRPLVRMAVGPSIWQPLLAGPAWGRLRRWGAQWWA